MVDWDRVEELREKGWEWDRIADDTKVGFHADAAMAHPGRALRTLYHHRRSREARQGPTAEKKISKRAADELEQRWTLKRYGFLLTPVFGLWFLFAYLVPSPIGLVLPAIPWLALAFAVVAFLLVFALWRHSGPRWNKVLRGTVISGVVLGLVFSALIAVGGVAFFGCPFLPATTTSQSDGWTSVGVASWQQSGEPVVYFYGATWCPYCSASSWALYKALTEFQLHFNPSSGGTGIPGAYTSYSDGAPEPYPYTPNVVFANAAVNSQTIAFVVNEAQNVSDGTFPGTTNCIESAYVSAYSGSSIPFVALNGQYIHGGSSLINPAYFSSYEGTGAPAVLSSVLSESGTPWSYVSAQAYWITALLVKASGQTVSNLASTYHGTDQWTTSFQAGVNADLSQLGYSG